MREECGVFGICHNNLKNEIAQLSYLGLFALQHRGQESAGIAVSSGKNILVYRDLGLVGEVFKEGILSTLQGIASIGHVRYSAASLNSWQNSQPILQEFAGGSFALAHNGHLTNQSELRTIFGLSDQNFHNCPTDSHLICKLIQTTREKNMEKALEKIIPQLKGAFCLTILTEGKLIGLRDAQGFHPLVLGRLGDGYALASEDCAFSIIGAQYLREVQPGEMIVIENNRYRTKQILAGNKKALCIFEHVYFARPDSNVFEENVAEIRERIGRRLAQEQPAEADMVICVPDSGRFAALGYAHEANILYQEGLLKNNYIGRTYIQPNQKLREYTVKIKLSAIAGIVAGKRIVMVDDSIVRGTTSRNLVKLLKNAGAKEVHVRISSPPVNYSCHYDIATPAREELWTNRFSLDKLRQWLEADSLGYISLKGLTGVFQKNKPADFCTACFSGEYPV
ncbi:MAG TPA: amidophosphoribosyltransferase [Atribacterota bacterium]|nr:amidophosphoribosyltransferase [Atribacterota bacterium]